MPPDPLTQRLLVTTLALGQAVRSDDHDAIASLLDARDGIVKEIEARGEHASDELMARADQLGADVLTELISNKLEIIQNLRQIAMLKQASRSYQRSTAEN